MVYLLVMLGFLNYFAVEEIVWVYFIDWRQNNSISILTMGNSNGESVYVQAFVNMLTSPDSGLVKGFVIFGVIEQLEESNSLL